MIMFIPIEKQSGVFGEGPKNKKNASKHPGFNGSESLSLGSVGGDGVENVDQNQEESD